MSDKIAVIDIHPYDAFLMLNDMRVWDLLRTACAGDGQIFSKGQWYRENIATQPSAEAKAHFEGMK